MSDKMTSKWIKTTQGYAGRNGYIVRASKGFGPFGPDRKKFLLVFFGDGLEPIPSNSIGSLKSIADSHLAGVSL